MQSLSKDDFRRIMNDTLDHMLRVMSRRERMEFIDDIVNNAVSRMLAGLSNEEKAQLLQRMLPAVLAQFPNAAEALAAHDQSATTVSAAPVAAPLVHVPTATVPPSKESAARE